jgi:hypothetical protein
MAIHTTRGAAVRSIAAWIRRVITAAGTPDSDGATLDHGWVIDRCRYADRSWER